MLAMGVGLAILGPFAAYGMFAIERGLPFGPAALAIGAPGWVPFIAISGYVLLLFPDGHLPSPRWRWFAWVCGIGLALVIVAIWLGPGDFADSGYPDVRNPFGVEALAPFFDVFGFLLLAAPLLVVGGFVGLVVRLRRTTDNVVRHQIRWLTYEAALIAGLFALSFIPGVGNEAWDSVIQNLASLLFILIPVIVGSTILQYRLYDIDVVIRRPWSTSCWPSSSSASGSRSWPSPSPRLPCSPPRSTAAASTCSSGSHRCARLAAGRRFATDRRAIMSVGRASPSEVLTDFRRPAGGDVRSRRRPAADRPRPRRRASAPSRARVWLAVGDEARARRDVVT